MSCRPRLCSAVGQNGSMGKALDLTLLIRIRYPTPQPPGPQVPSSHRLNSQVLLIMSEREGFPQAFLNIGNDLLMEELEMPGATW